MRVRLKLGRSSHLSALPLPIHLSWLPRRKTQRREINNASYENYDLSGNSRRRKWFLYPGPNCKMINVRSVYETKEIFDNGTFTSKNKLKFSSVICWFHGSNKNGTF